MFVLRCRATSTTYNYGYAIMTPADSGLNKATAILATSGFGIYLFSCYVSGDSVQIGSHSGAYILEVYGLKASGGGVAPEPEPEQSEIWYDGNQTTSFTKEGVDIFDYQRIEVVVDTSPTEQATETFTYPFEDFMSLPEGYVMLTIGQSLFFETSATRIRKITAYK